MSPSTGGVASVTLDFVSPGAGDGGGLPGRHGSHGPGFDSRGQVSDGTHLAALFQQRGDCLHLIAVARYCEALPTVIGPTRHSILEGHALTLLVLPVRFVHFAVCLHSCINDHHY